jgi:hypothetical protein
MMDITVPPPALGKDFVRPVDSCLVNDFVSDLGGEREKPFLAQIQESDCFGAGPLRVVDYEQASFRGVKSDYFIPVGGDLMQEHIEHEYRIDVSHLLDHRRIAEVASNDFDAFSGRGVDDKTLGRVSVHNRSLCCRGGIEDIKGIAPVYAKSGSEVSKRHDAEAISS